MLVMTIEAGKELIPVNPVEERGLVIAGSGDKSGYIPGLDGLRAVAVLAVMFYHAGISFMVGGFLGVDVFFVISGFLITTLLLVEYRQKGRTNLKAFWWRRARRLLPALFLLLLVTVIFSVIFLPDEVTGLRGDVVAALAYVTNWELIFNQRSYFEAVGRPPLLRHLWSLAVEEQFYIIWPVVFSLGMAVTRRRYLIYALGLAAIASSVWMALQYQPDADPSRIYYGTDTRAAGLLVGVLLAFIPFLSPEIAWRGWRTQLTSWLLDLGGLVSLAVLLYSFVMVDQFQSFLYQGGYLLLSMCTAVLIAGVAHPLSHWGVIFDWRPLRWIGQRSYSLYLWHWPVFNITRPQLDLPLDGLPLLALRFGLTFLLADLSYRFVETPLRYGKLERLWQSWKTTQGEARRKLKLRWLGVSIPSALLSVMLVLALVEAKAPPPPDYLPGETPGAVAGVPIDFENTPVTDVVEPTPEPTLAVTATPTEIAISPTVLAPGATPEPTSTPTPTATPDPTATPKPTSTPKPAPPVTAVGDSVMLGAGNELHRLIGPMIYEADVGMQAKTGVEMIRSFLNQGQLGPTVVIHLGTNGYFADKSFDDMMSVIGPNRRVFFVNVRAPREWETPNNKVIRDGVKRYDNAFLIDWYSVSAGHPEYFIKDGVHLTASGIRVYTTLIANKIK